MIDIAAENIVKNHLAAVRRAIDPHRTVLMPSTPYVVAGSIGPVDAQQLAAGALAAHGADADYFHLVFEPGAEGDGPVNVAVGMVRFGTVHVFQTCRFWLGKDGAMVLVANAGGKFATITFDAEGAESRPGRPSGSLAEGYRRAAARLRSLARTPASANDTVTIRMVWAA